jgi:hypothetical protein|uniref:Uncharacterized protein n=1 Tax=Sipha flava TaxID=143950 RepID=A0A2S2Q5I5_9HEMI
MITVVDGRNVFRTLFRQKTFCRSFERGAPDYGTKKQQQQKQCRCRLVAGRISSFLRTKPPEARAPPPQNRIKATETWKLIFKIQKVSIETRRFVRAAGF